jgi:hypothetical protein
VPESVVLAVPMTIVGEDRFLSIVVVTVMIVRDLEVSLTAVKLLSPV